MDEIDPPVRDTFGGAAAEDVRARLLVRAGTVVRAAAVVVGLVATGAFLSASPETDARGRVGAAALEEATEPVGDATELRPPSAGLADVEADNGALTDGLVAVLIGTTEALRTAVVDATGAFDADVADGIGGFVAEVAGTDALRNVGVAAFAGAAGGAALAPVGLTVPAPNVPEVIICRMSELKTGALKEQNANLLDGRCGWSIACFLASIDRHHRLLDRSWDIRLRARRGQLGGQGF